MSILWREKETVGAMVRLFCSGRHGSEELCPSCGELLAYAHARLDRCPFGEGKPVCADCSVHCYKPDMRDRIREAMRYAGPRMPWHHPWRALVHVARSFKKASPRLGRSA
ncbi:MAG: nitrous oxide-stimulated promoter family protein [Elusimicrobia bacterium]|jgi:hypothetical protein|nr:nitrous oxide-stimulated promoter family protein [Elusimicrobiota bacterium]MBK7208680.1 nitrous oxide-stimulated promoter family protein [Elusimicrobiota bacterium]MBK7545423.1 nitrous oxide-stimulated promoter family protein [Elusimicrobiota bacterium]MBK7575561.1 nitrous oxide-stimulated promoter family protein [Elusimicrobiota bacterium]MBK7688471.1 nitrous oxide-stimulated promoter family protein [Elusimicrobiota bacterium]